MPHQLPYYKTLMTARVVAVLGRKLLPTRFSLPAEPAGFKRMTWLQDDALPKRARKPIPSLATEFSASIMEPVR